MVTSPLPKGLLFFLFMLVPVPVPVPVPVFLRDKFNWAAAVFLLLGARLLLLPFWDRADLGLAASAPAGQPGASRAP